MEVAGKVVVVTGGGSGIGAALCERFAREGARGIAVADLDEGSAQRVADAIGGVALRCEVSSEGDIRAVIEHVEARLGPIDLFCSNAGVLANDPDPLDPQGVAMPMVAGALKTPAVQDGLLTPRAVAQTVIEGLAAERFLILPHPQVLTYMQRKAADYDRWPSGMVRLSQGASSRVG